MNVVVIALALVLGQAPAQEPQPTQPQQPAQPVQPGQPPSPAAEPRIRASFPVLTLEDALARAGSENLDLRAAQARLDQANTVSRQVWSGQLPQVSATGRYTRNQDEVRFPISATETVTIQALDQWSATLDASQVLFAPGLWLAIRNAYRTEDVAAANVEAARRDILFGVAQSYYAVASLLQSVEVADRLLEIAQRQERDSRVRYQAGTIPKVALLRAEIDRARAEQDVRRAVNQY
ncbi:MAG TPA: TolC family protein, partial [Anaeromyxobacteraceae bacterium]|nr:TolC family protein [Anaeromyxobacteraceae bacterium]